MEHLLAADISGCSYWSSGIALRDLDPGRVKGRFDCGLAVKAWAKKITWCCDYRGEKNLGRMEKKKFHIFHPGFITSATKSSLAEQHRVT